MPEMREHYHLAAFLWSYSAIIPCLEEFEGFDPECSSSLVEFSGLSGCQFKAFADAQSDDDYREISRGNGPVSMVQV
jgi:hypothetical protein